MTVHSMRRSLNPRADVRASLPSGDEASTLAVQRGARSHWTSLAGPTRQIQVFGCDECAPNSLGAHASARIS